MTKISKLLIANRGEIACRVIRTSRRMGIETVAVYSEADVDAVHVQAADEAHCIGPAPARESYLRGDKLIEVALTSGAQGIHPGYGFLAESADFATAVVKAGLIWVGPSAAIISDMGDKGRARAIAAEAGVPTVPGSRRFPPGDTEGLAVAAEKVGFPLLVKASAGGGGIGMRRVDSPAEVLKVVEATQAMAERTFGDGTVFLERFVERARHVEVQVFGFGSGAPVHLFDRDCSVQRRFQKVIEEAPSPALPDALQEAMRTAAVNLAAKVNYEGAGTVEFIYDVDRQGFYFLEMNTRIQVEHAVTEMITGVDLIEWQIKQAAGSMAPVAQECIEYLGHAVEARIYAERPEKNFLPSPGLIEDLDWPPARAGLRIDHAVRAGDKITPYYDPMICKIVCHGPDRAAAVALLDDAVGQFRLKGISTNAAFVRQILTSEAFSEARMTTTLVAMQLL